MDSPGLDLESQADRARIMDPEAAIRSFRGRLVVLDKIQRCPELFPVLRVLADRYRQEGRRAGHFFVLGSASVALLRQCSESFAGRFEYLELAPRLPKQSSEFNAARLAAELGVSEQTVSRYLDLLVDLMFVRRLPAWFENTGKRLRNSPGIVLRDSGIVHPLLGIDSLSAPLVQPVCGESWEGFVVENLVGAAGAHRQAVWYRTSAGAAAVLTARIATTPRADVSC